MARDFYNSVLTQLPLICLLACVYVKNYQCAKAYIETVDLFKSLVMKLDAVITGVNITNSLSKGTSDNDLKKWTKIHCKLTRKIFLS